MMNFPDVEAWPLELQATVMERLAKEYAEMMELFLLEMMDFTLTMMDSAGTLCSRGRTWRRSGCGIPSLTDLKCHY